MIKKPYLLLTTSLIGVVLCLTTLYFSTDLPNQKKNGFTRKLNVNVVDFLISKQAVLPFKNICGATENHVFMSLPNPQWIIMMDWDLSKQDTLFFPINPVEKALTTNSLKIDSPWVYFFANNEPAIVLGKLQNGKIDNIEIKQLGSLFTQSTFIDSERLILRSLDTLSSNQVFQVVKMQDKKAIKEAGIVGNENDLGLSSGGSLEYDKTSHRMIYVQHFNNSLYCIDTNLNTVYTGNTIDTITQNIAEIKAVQIDGKDKLYPSSARVMVNRFACTAAGHLYVASELMADNEKINSFRSSSVIDIYSIGNGKYTSSFYLPNRGNKVKSFLLKDDRIVALYKEEIVIFKLRPK